MYFIYLFFLFFLQVTQAYLPNDPHLEKQWYLKNNGQRMCQKVNSETCVEAKTGFDLQVEKAWEVTQGSPEVIVAVVDTGLDLNHIEFANNLLINTKEKNGQPGIDDDGNGFIDDVYGYDFVDNDPDPTDTHFGHGTHITSIIAAEGDNGIGMAGIAWKSRILPVRAVSSSSGEEAHLAAQGIRYAADRGAHIINCSFSYNYDEPQLLKAIRYARKKGALVIAAAGNDSESLDMFPMYPSNYKEANLIIVTALDEKYSPTYFGNMSPNFVHLMAPGTWIWGLLSSEKARFWDGTSQAAAVVSGVAALAKAINLNASWKKIKEKILNSVDVSPAWKEYSSTSGVINAWKAVQ